MKTKMEEYLAWMEEVMGNEEVRAVRENTPDPADRCDGQEEKVQSPVGNEAENGTRGNGRPEEGTPAKQIKSCFGSECCHRKGLQ